MNSIKHWYEHADSHDSYEDRFIALWISFNGYCTMLSSGSQESRMMEWVKRNHGFKNAYHEMLDASPEFRRCLEELKSLCPVIDMRPGLGYKSKTITDIRNFDQTLDVIYKIRCNLFHGSKDLTSERDKRLAMLGYDVLRRIYHP